MILRFFKKISALILVLSSSLYMLALMLDTGLRKSLNAYFASWNYLYYSKINAGLLIMGSSRAELIYAVNL